MESVTINQKIKNVSPIGLGTWAMGGFKWGGTNEQEALSAIKYALDSGINFIDTAPVYGFGLSEELIGKVLKQYGQRDQQIIATKFGIDWGEGTPPDRWRDARPRKIEEEFDQSLIRLQTDYIDLYQIHWPDPDTPMDLTAETVYSLYKKGKIRGIGVSNFSVQDMDYWKEVAPIHSCQIELNFLKSNYLSETVDYCKKNNITILSWGSLAHGLLTGKFNLNTKFTSSDFRSNHLMFKGENFYQNLQVIDELKEFARSKGKTTTQVALRWLLDHVGVDIVLWGARRPDQLKEVKEILEWNLSQNDIEILASISAKIPNNIDNNSLGPARRVNVRR